MCDQNHLADRRGVIEQLLNLSENLSQEDRALLRSVYDAGLSPTLLAHASGRDSRRMRQRVARLVGRIGSDMFQFVLRERQDWPAPRRRIAELIFLRGQTQRDVAAASGTSLHHVRREIERIRALREESRRRAADQP
jgi:hypothetical protein